MKKTAKRISWWLVAAMLVAMLTACGGGATDVMVEPSAEPPEVAPSTVEASAAAVENGTERDAVDGAEGLRLVDMTGREVLLDGPAEKVVALWPASCEILYALGAGDSIVGRGEYCDYPEAVLDVPTVQSGADSNVEQIIALAPQLVITSTMAQQDGQIQQLTDAGIPVIVSEAYDIAGTYESIQLIGAAVGREAEAMALVADMQQGFADIQSMAAAQEESLSVYFEISPLEYGLWSAGQGSFYQEIADMLNVKNIFDDMDTPYAEVSEEQVIARNPDVIVTITMYYGDGPRPEEEIAGRTGWQQLSAVQNGRIFLANADELSRPAPRLVDGARSLYEFIYDGAAQTAQPDADAA